MSRHARPGMLHVFNAVAYATNAVLWAWLAHSPFLSIVSAVIAIGSAWMAKVEADA